MNGNFCYTTCIPDTHVHDHVCIVGFRGLSIWIGRVGLGEGDWIWGCWDLGLLRATSGCSVAGWGRVLGYEG